MEPKEGARVFAVPEGLSPTEERLLVEAVRVLLEDETLAARYRQASRERAEQLAIGRICEQWIEAIETR